MHRTLDLAISSREAPLLVKALAEIDGVVQLNHEQGTSIVPPGDRITVHVLNKAVDSVLRELGDDSRYGDVSVVTSEVASITDVRKQYKIDHDVDEAIWEEMETGLRHQGRITQNYMALMAIGGFIAGAGLLATHETDVQVMAAIAAAVIAPGFDPLAKIPLGLILHRWEVLLSGLSSFMAGYGVLIAAAALSYLLMAMLGATPLTGDFLKSEAVKRIGDPSWADLLISAAGAFAGMIVQASFRQAIIAGALIALTIIDAAALIGVGTVMMDGELIGNGLTRLGIDVAIIFAAGIAVFAFKQAVVHRRTPLR